MSLTLKSPLCFQFKVNSIIVNIKFSHILFCTPVMTSSQLLYLLPPDVNTVLVYTSLTLSFISGYLSLC